MEYLTIAATLMGFTALVISCTVALAKYPPVQLGRLRKKLNETQLECADLRDLYESLLTSHKKLAARSYMREARAKKAENGKDQNDPNQLDDDEWRAMMNRKLGLGQIGIKE